MKRFEGFCVEWKQKQKVVVFGPKVVVGFGIFMTEGSGYASRLEENHGSGSGFGSDPKCPERLDTNTVNIRPDPKP